MPSSDTPSLGSLAAAAGALESRFIEDASTRFPLTALTNATTLAAPGDAFAGSCVVLRTATQLATALALLELDGVARRIVVCTPDLSAEHFRHAIEITSPDFLVSEQSPPELAGTGIVFIASHGPAVLPAPPRPASARPTEWALFTSGTTSAPKIAVHSLSGLTGAMARNAPTPATPSAWATFYDIRRYGGLQILLRALLGGGSMVLSDAHESVGDFLARAGAAKVDFISGTPTHWRRALLCPASNAIQPRNVRLSGEIADQAILDKLRLVYPTSRICHAFASTEAGVAFEVCDGFAGFPASWIGESRGGVELDLREGTLHIRSPRAADRYLGMAAGPLKQPDGFVDTKDLVERRDDRCYFMGRRDGVINVGGLKVHPEEVEAVVNHHPRVEMSRVWAKRSPIIGQVIAVDVVLRQPETAPDPAAARVLEAEILAACRARMAAHKVPATVRVVPTLPVTAAGKLVRSVA